MAINKEDVDVFVKVANKAADAAGDVIRQYFWNPAALDTSSKYDVNGCIVEQTTNADIAAEKAIVEILRENFPDHLVYGEENGWEPKDITNADYVWVIDPIDGTKSFMNGIPLFGTLIALLYKSEPIIGILDQPRLRERWVGVQGRRTTMNGRVASARCCEQLSGATLYTSSHEHFSDEEYVAFKRVQDKVFPETGYGVDCYMYGLLANGFIDLIIQSFLGPYDFLAFIPIIEGAGGIVTDWKGQKLQWEASPMFQGPSYYSIIAAGDKRVHREAIELLNASN